MTAQSWSPINRFEPLPKIGVTTRPISKRLAEIQRDLRSHFQTIAINVLGTWASRGNVEKYFKYKYSSFNYPIGSLTEYFKLDAEEAIAVKRDLDQMKPKVLSQVEQDIVEGKPSPIEQALRTETKSQEQSHYSELERVFLSSPSSGQVIQALHQGHSLRHAAEIASVAVNTARKVLAVLQKQQISD